MIFIGASSGSTSGGIKVSTLAVIFIYIINLFKGKKPTIFKRQITDDTIKRAFTIFFLAIAFILLGVFSLSLTETLPEGIGIEYIVTEVVSALGVAGISLGLTPHLSTIGKVILMLLMLVGRVGVMTFLWSLVGEKSEVRINYPDIQVLIG